MLQKSDLSASKSSGFRWSSPVWRVGLSLSLAAVALAAVCFLGLGLSRPAVQAAPPADPVPALARVQDSVLRPSAVLSVCQEGGPVTCPYTNVQAALLVAGPRDEIQVAAGLYQGVNNYGSHSQVVYVDQWVTIRGGYSPDFGDWDPELYPTILDAQGLGRVVYVDMVTATLEGLNLTRGAGYVEGGGVYATDATLTVSGCQVYSNTATGAGGGIYVLDGQADIRHSRVYENSTSIDEGVRGGGICLQSVDGPSYVIASQISSNTAKLFGGGLALYQDSHLVVVSENKIYANQTTVAGSQGGGINVNDSLATLDANQIYSNTATGRSSGAGIYVRNADQTVISNNEIHDNWLGDAGAGGGGLYLKQSDTLITANRIYGNRVKNSGGGGGSGIYVDQSRPLIDANYIYDNWTGHRGSGLYIATSAGFTLTNNVVADNQVGGTPPKNVWANDLYASQSSGWLAHNTFGAGASPLPESVVVAENSDLVLVNSIVVSRDLGLRLISGTLVADHTLWDGQGSFSQGNVSTTVVIEGAPAFTSTDCSLVANRCYHISADSDAIDVAVDAGVDQDIDGDFRLEGAIDLGADEFQLIAGVALSPGAERDGYHGQVLPVEHVLGNTGNGPDTYDIDALSRDQDWTLDYPAQVSLDRGDVTSLIVNLTVPSGVPSGTQDVLLITATSQADPSVVASAVNTVVVRLTPEASLSPGSERLVDVETWVTYTHVLTNQANGPDVFDVQCANDWGTATCPASASLAPQASQALTVNVQVPAGVGGLTDVTQLVVTSRYDPQMQVSAQDATTARHWPGLALTPGQTGRVDPAALITYVHWLTNTGNGPDSFDVACVSSRGWDLVCPSTVDLAYEQSYPLVISLTARPGEISGTLDSTVLTVTSQADPMVGQVVTDETTVNFFISGVALESATPQAADPQRIARYEHVVTNLGNATDRFDISHRSSQSWTVSYDSPIQLGREATHTLVISVHVPQVLSGTVETTVITVTAQSNPDAFGRVTDTTTVNLVAGVALSSVPGQSLYPGEMVTYTHVLTNLSNYSDTFDLNQSSSSGWTAYLPPRLVMGYGETRSFNVRVRAPAGAVSGTVGHTTVFAFSRIDPSAQASVLDRTTVIGDATFDVYLPIVLKGS